MKLCDCSDWRFLRGVLFLTLTLNVQGRSYLGWTRSISYDIDYVEYVGPGLTWGRILRTCVISMWSNDIKCKYMFMFHLKRLKHCSTPAVEKFLTWWFPVFGPVKIGWDPSKFCLMANKTSKVLAVSVSVLIVHQGVWKYFSASVQTWKLKMGFTTS